MSANDDYLMDELDHGKRLAEELVKHVERMGAGEAEWPLPGQDAMWLVKVQRMGVVDPKSS